MLRKREAWTLNDIIDSNDRGLLSGGKLLNALRLRVETESSAWGRGVGGRVCGRAFFRWAGENGGGRDCVVAFELSYELVSVLSG